MKELLSNGFYLIPKNCFAKLFEEFEEFSISKLSFLRKCFIPFYPTFTLRIRICLSINDVFCYEILTMHSLKTMSCFSNLLWQAGKLAFWRIIAGPLTNKSHPISLKEGNIFPNTVLFLSPCFMWSYIIMKGFAKLRFGRFHNLGWKRKR